MSTKRKPQSIGQRMLNVRVDSDLIDRLRVVAERDERTVSQEVRHLITQRVESAEDADTAKAAA